MNGNREYGDYQTPTGFADQVCRYLKDIRQIRPSAIVEPTCGVGNFLKSSLILQANEYYGIEINPEYCEKCRDSINDSRIQIINSNFFSFSTKTLIQDKRQILILGNPPWVTNSALTALSSDNLPKKVNFKGLKGIDAITGASNFDICEYMILQLIHEYRDTNTIIAMLCKTAVARNVFRELKRNCIAFSSCDVLEFDAKAVFGINASTCLFVLQLSDQAVAADYCNVYAFDEPETLRSRFGYSRGSFYSNMDFNNDDFDGECCFSWRQGVKHDCAKVMELTLKDGMLQNGLGKIVQLENELVFPLVKSSMFKTPVIYHFSKFVIMTQKKAREETNRLKITAPKTWEYLNENLSLFENRKSSIYQGAPPFSMFGVGDYSYSRYKVGISGFNKSPLFSLLYSEDDKPVMTDDTCYFIGFDCYDMAYVAMLLLNSDRVQRFLMSVAFLDAKRPFTKKVLERIDFDKITDAVGIEELEETERSLQISNYVSAPMYDRFKSQLGMRQLKFA